MSLLVLADWIHDDLWGPALWPLLPGLLPAPWTRIYWKLHNVFYNESLNHILNKKHFWSAFRHYDELDTLRSSRVHFGSFSSFTSSLTVETQPSLLLSLPLSLPSEQLLICCVWLLVGLECLRGVWAKLSRHVTAPADHRAEVTCLTGRRRRIPTRTLWIFTCVLLPLFDSTEQPRWIRAKLNLSLLNIPTMTTQTGTPTTQSQLNHPKSEYESPVRVKLDNVIVNHEVENAE